MNRPDIGQGVKLSANLGTLWTELELCEAIRAASSYGFDAVEVHWPYITHALQMALALEETGLELVSLNTVAGDLARGDFGLAAVSGREVEARAAIDKALAYAVDASAQWIHVLAGLSSGSHAENTYVRNLHYAAERGHQFGVGVLIEPMWTGARPGYFLNDLDQAVDVVAEVDEPNVRLLFDCYHMSMAGQDPLPAIVGNLGVIGHIQFASIPDRHEPDRGLIDYGRLIPAVVGAGYTGYFGAEYRPESTTESGLGWMRSFR